jgi:hypothetical protein
MAARDVFHRAVRNALEKDGWTITDDPLEVEIGDVEMYIDLGAERLLAAQRAGQKIAVEIKSFIGPSNISEFHTALGQFFNYRIALEEQDPNRVLYLAVPSGTYQSFFQKKFVQIVVERSYLKLIVYDPIDEVIVTWKR